MKVVNTVKLKEEFDYESLCRKLETQVDYLSADVDRQQRLRENETNELKKLLKEFENSSAEAEKKFAVRAEVYASKNSTFFFRFLCRVSLNNMSGCSYYRRKTLI